MVWDIEELPDGTIVTRRRGKDYEYKTYEVNGRLHRTDGPAVERIDEPSEEDSYYYRGVRLDTSYVLKVGLEAAIMRLVMTQGTG